MFDENCLKCEYRVTHNNSESSCGMDLMYPYSNCSQKTIKDERIPSALYELIIAYIPQYVCGFKTHVDIKYMPIDTYMDSIVIILSANNYASYRSFYFRSNYNMDTVDFMKESIIKALNELYEDLSRLINI